MVIQYVVGDCPKYSYWDDVYMYVKPYDTTLKPLYDYERHILSWDDLVEILKTPEISLDKNTCSMFNLCDFNINESSKKRTSDKNISRCIENLEQIYGLVLDYDEGYTYEQAKKDIGNLKYLAYSSFNHNWNKREKKIDKSIEKFRIVIPFKEPATAYEFQNRLYALKDRFPGVDKSTFMLSRIFFVYSTHPDRKELGFFEERDGELFDLFALEEQDDYYEFDDTEPIEITDQNKIEIIEAIKSMDDERLHYMDAFKIVTYCKNINIPYENIRDALTDKIALTSSLYNDNEQLKRLYHGAKNVSIGLFKKTIREFGGDDRLINVKMPRGIQKLIDIEPGISNRFTMHETEEDIKRGVEDFFNNKNNVLLAHEPGSGKTKITMDSIVLIHKESKRNKVLYGEESKIFVDGSNLKIDWFGYNNSNIDDVYNYLLAKKINVRKVLGRENFCEHEFFKIKRDKDHPDYDILRDIKEADFCNENCPFHRMCEYPKQFTKDAAVSIKHHSFLFNNESYWDRTSKREATHIIIDESVLGDGFEILLHSIDKFPPVTKRILEAFSKRSKEIKSIVEFNNFPDIIEKIFNKGPKEERIESTMDIFNPRVQISDTPSLFERLCFEAEELKTLNKIYYAELQKCGLSLDALRAFYASDIGKPSTYSLTRTLIEVLNNLNNGIDDYTFAVDGGYLISREIAKYKGKWAKQPKLLLDATPTIDLLPFKFNVYDLLTNWSPNLYVEQIYDKSFSKSMIEREGDTLKNQMVEWLIRLCNEKKIGLITYKYYHSELEKDPRLQRYVNDNTLLIGHFGGNKGTNRFEDRDVLIILGQYRENPESIYHKARIKYGKDISMAKETMRKGVYKMRKGNWKEQKRGYRIYSDSRIQMLADVAETSEMIQSIGRIRPTRVALKKSLYIVTNRPFDVTVDKLTLWNNMITEEQISEDGLGEGERLVLEYLKLIMSDGKERSRELLLNEIMSYANIGSRKAVEVFGSIKNKLLEVCDIKVGRANSHTYVIKR